MKRSRTYRASAGRAREGSRRRVAHLTMTGSQRATIGPHCPTTGLQRETTAGSARRRERELKKETGDDGYATPDDGYRVRRQRVLLMRQRRRSRDDGTRVGRRRVALRATTGPTPHGRFAAIVYKGGRLDQDSRSD